MKKKKLALLKGFSTSVFPVVKADWGWQAK
jgi:hypothetical protein